MAGPRSSLAPPVVLILGAGLAFAVYRRRAAPVRPLDEEEEAALRRAMSGGKGTGPGGVALR